MFPPHTHKRTFIIPHQGFKVRMIVLAYREISDGFAMSCFAAFVRKQGRKKLKSNIELTFPTAWGAV